MFEKYNINDLFLASIDIRYPSYNIGEVDIGGIFTMKIGGGAGYGYLTILRKEGERYIDLQNESIEITTTKNHSATNYTIDYMEPLSKYYNQNGKRKETLSRRKAIKVANQYYDEIHKNHLEQLDEKAKIYRI